MDLINTNLIEHLAILIFVLVLGGIVARFKWNQKDGVSFKGFGWQFIRYITLSIILPVISILVLIDKIDANIAVPIFTAALGYVFAKNDDSAQVGSKEDPH